MHPVALVSALAVLSAAGAAAAPTPGVEVRDAVARVVVTPEARGDAAVSVTRGDPRLPPLAVRRDGARWIVDGGLEHRIGDCQANDLNWNGRHTVWDRSVGVRGVGRVRYADLPVVTVHTPLHTAVGASGAVWGEVGPSEQLNLAHSGCGDWTVAPVRGALDLASTGSGDTRARTAGRLHYAVQGSGDLYMDAVDGPADFTVSGSGDIRLGHVAGPVSATIAGSGDVHIAAGRSPSVQVTVAGSGDFGFGGEAAALSATVSGSGDVHVARVTGPVAKVVHGSGEVTVGR